MNTLVIDNPVATEAVRYTPGDCALLVGASDLLFRHVESVRVVGLRPALLCTDLPDLDRLPRSLRALPGELAGLNGWMGAFTARTRGARGDIDLAPLSFHEDGHFDWVLDFSPTPCLKPSVPPPGYYALPADDYAALKGTLLEIAARLRDGHEKPRYFCYDEARCAHRRQDTPGCDACVGACAAGAITTTRDGIRIEAHLCQGCGACALVCPSGAVRHIAPGTPDRLRQLRALLAARAEAAGLWLVDDASWPAPEGWLALAVGEPASLGLEFWLAALASGCARVAIATAGAPAESCRALAEQVGLGQTILAGLGLPLALALADDVEALADVPRLASTAVDELATGDMATGDDKRALLFAAIDALSALGAHAPAPIPLPVGPLGEVRVAAEKCTLCAACVRICPNQALHLAGGAMRLALVEERCLQCGLCANVCPENAIELAPRLVIAPDTRRTPRIIAEGEPFACSECGQQYTTRAMFERGRAMMAGHPMFQGEQARLMSLCPDCRRRAMAGA